MKSGQKIAVFTYKYPFIGPMVWILTVQFFIIQVVTAAWSPALHAAEECYDNGKSRQVKPLSAILDLTALLTWERKCCTLF